jgi:hypothetical protein
VGNATDERIDQRLVPEFDALKTRFPAGFESSLVLPCLRRVQEEQGYVGDSAIDDLVAYLGVPRIQIEEVLSFYTQFRRHPLDAGTSGLSQRFLLDARRRTCARSPVEKLGIGPGTDDCRRPLHAFDGRVPRFVRHCAGRNGQRGHIAKT